MKEQKRILTNSFGCALVISALALLYGLIKVIVDHSFGHEPEVPFTVTEALWISGTIFGMVFIVLEVFLNVCELTRVLKNFFKKHGWRNPVIKLW